MKKLITGHKNYQDLFLDWINNFLTVEKFAAYYNVEIDIASELIESATWLYKDKFNK